MKLYELCEKCNYSERQSSENILTYKCTVDNLVKDDDEIGEEICSNYEENGSWDEALSTEEELTEEELDEEAEAFTKEVENEEKINLQDDMKNI